MMGFYSVNNVGSSRLFSSGLALRLRSDTKIVTYFLSVYEKVCEVFGVSQNSSLTKGDELKKHIVVINAANKFPGSFCRLLAKEYAASASNSGHSIQSFDLAEMEFDPVLHNGYNQKQSLEPSLKKIQESLSEANHIVLIYPHWWGGPPAKLKGLFDRVLLPDFAFKYEEGKAFATPLLTGKTARVIVTSDTPGWYNKLVYREPGHKMVRKNILNFCGIKPVKFTHIAPIRKSSDASREKWVSTIRQLGKKGS